MHRCSTDHKTKHTYRQRRQHYTGRWTDRQGEVDYQLPTFVRTWEHWRPGWRHPACCPQSCHDWYDTTLMPLPAPQEPQQTPAFHRKTAQSQSFPEIFCYISPAGWCWCAPAHTCWSWGDSAPYSQSRSSPHGWSSVGCFPSYSRGSFHTAPSQGRGRPGCLPRSTQNGHALHHTDAVAPSQLFPAALYTSRCPEPSKASPANSGWRAAWGSWWVAQSTAQRSKFHRHLRLLERVAASRTQ